MFSSLPKVLVPVCGRPMLFLILDRLSEVSPGARVALVVGHQKEKVIEQVIREEFPLSISFVEQFEQKGTGHAVKCVMEAAWGLSAVKNKETVLVLPGDLPLITSGLLQEMLEPLKRGSVMKLLTAILPDPTGYGRIIRKGKKGGVLRITEEKDANLREKLVKEVGVSIYSFQAAFLASGTASLKNSNAQKEYYLTDLVEAAVSKKRTIETTAWESPEDVRGVNNPYELAQAGGMLNARILREHALAGVRIIDLGNTRIDPCVRIGKEAVVHPGAVLEGRTEIAEGSVWALMGMGVRCVIAPSFGDIFFANCFQNGLLPVRLPIAVIRQIAEETEASPGNARTTVDLERRVVITPTGTEIPFEVDTRKREAMLHGLDDIALTKRHAEAIAAWREGDRAARPWAWDSVA